MSIKYGPTLLLLAASAFAASSALGQTLFLTGRGDSIRTSSDGGATWSTFATVSGGQLRGLDVGNVGGSNYVFTNNINGGDNTSRPLIAYNSAGTQVATTTYNNNGAFNEQPVGYFGGYVYGSSGGTPQNYSTSFNGSAFGTVGDSGVGNFQGNNLAFATSGLNSYIFTIGTSGSTVRRNLLNGNGTVSAQTTVTTASGPADLRDIAFTSSGRLLTIGATGIFLSAANNVATDAITLSSAFSFGATENAATGDMGANARDFSIVGSTLYAVTDTRVFSYTLDDTTGTLTFLNAYLHGFNNGGVQIAGISAIPEPSTFAALAGLGVLGLAASRRRRS